MRHDLWTNRNCSDDFSTAVRPYIEISTGVADIDDSHDRHSSEVLLWVPVICVYVSKIVVLRDRIKFSRLLEITLEHTLEHHVQFCAAPYARCISELGLGTSFQKHVRTLSMLLVTVMCKGISCSDLEEAMSLITREDEHSNFIQPHFRSLRRNAELCSHDCPKR